MWRVSLRHWFCSLALRHLPEEVRSFKNQRGIHLDQIGAERQALPHILIVHHSADGDNQFSAPALAENLQRLRQQLLRTWPERAAADAAFLREFQTVADALRRVREDP